MDRPYDTPESTVLTRTKKRSIRRFVGWSFLAAATFFAFVFVLNFVGCCLHLYLQVGSQDLSFGGGIGVARVGLNPHIETTEWEADDILGPPPEWYWHTDIVKFGPVHLFAEPPSDTFQPLRFDYVNEGDYFAVEFPLLLLTAVFAVLGGLLLRGRRKTE